MLETLRKFRDLGYPDFMVNNLARYQQEYKRIPLSERIYIDFEYFMRCKYIEILRKQNR